MRLIKQLLSLPPAGNPFLQPLAKVKEIMNATWVMLVGAALYITQDNTDESQAMRQSDFGYNSKTLDIYAGSDSKDETLTVTSQQLLVLGSVAIPLAWYLVKKLWTYYGRRHTAANLNEERLATPTEIMQSLLDSCDQAFKDFNASGLNALMLAPLLPSGLLIVFESWIEQLISYLNIDENSRSGYGVGLSAVAYIIFATPMLAICYLLLSHQGKNRHEIFYDVIIEHATEMTFKEIKQYKKSPFLMRHPKLLFLTTTGLLFVLVRRAKYISKFSLPLAVSYSFVLVLVNWVGNMFSQWDRDQYRFEIQALLESHQTAIKDTSELIEHLTVTKDISGILSFHAANKWLNDFPRMDWFLEMASFFKEEFNDNPLFINPDIFTILMTPISTSFGDKTAWQFFFPRLEALKRRRNRCNSSIAEANRFFQRHFHIQEAMSLILNYGDTKKTTFTLEINITSLKTEFQEKITQVISQELSTQAENTLGILSLGPIEQIKLSQIRNITKTLGKEFQIVSESKSLTSTNPVIYITTKHFFWQQNKRPKAKPRKVKESKIVTSPATLFTPQSISFGDYIYNSSDPKCLIKPLPGGPPNTFITLDAKLLEKLETLPSHDKEFVWLTPTFDAKIHKLPKIRFKPGEILSNGRTLFLKICSEGESRLTSSRCIKVTSADGKVTYVLFVVDQYHKKLHDRTRHADSNALRIGEMRQQVFAS